MDEPLDDLVGLFDGVRVLEIGQFVAAPIAAELFAHGGADVVKLEPVTGDQNDRPIRCGRPMVRLGATAASTWSRPGEAGDPLDLSSVEGRDLARSFALRADVLITNLRPGTASRLGLDFDTLRKDNPRLVYGEINGYGDTGPLADRPSLDLIAASWSGLRLSTNTDDEGRPGHYEAYLCDYIAGLLLAFGVAAALRHREITGVGQRVGTSLAHAALFAQHRSASVFESTDGWKRELAARRESGEGFASLHRDRVLRTSPVVFFMTTYDTSDGAVSVGATGAMGQRLCDLFGLVDPRTTPAWADRDRRPVLLESIRRQLAAAMSAATTDDVLARLDAAGIPASPVRTLEQVLLDDDAHAAGLIYTADHPTLGRYTMPSAPITLSGTDYRARSMVAAHGEHTEELLAELGYDQTTIERLVADGIVARQSAP
ncbi:MAG: CoA transferase [Acidimicrobiales bacterium]